MHTQPEQPLCWFCKKNVPTSGCEHQAALYRVLEQNKTFIAVGTSYQQKYETMNVAIPRCQRCSRIHDRSDIVFLLIWVAVVIPLCVAYFSRQRVSPELWAKIFGVVIGVAVCSVFAAFPVGILKWVTDQVWRSTALANKHPQVQSLMASGWKLGDKPPYKWS